MDSRHQPQSPALRELVERGYVEACSDFEALDEHMLAGPVTFYNGYDPTGPSLHVGHLLTIMAMRILQKHGHRPIALIGGATAMVGDPSGKTETRKILTRETIDEHGRTYRSQFSQFVHFDRGESNDAILLNNADWLLNIGYIEFLRDVGRHFTVNRMIAAKTYKDRLDNEQPLSFLEFNYQLLQSYDFVHLLREHDCTLQVGGGDQWGNMVAGVDLVRRMHEGEQSPPSAACLTYTLLTTADGKKMGKTEKGAVWLDPERVTPYDYYQYWVNCLDADVGNLLRLYTQLDLDEVQRLEALEGKELRRAKERLAFEATSLLHGEQAATTAREAAKQAFGGGDDWSAVPEVSLGATPVKLLDLAAASGAFKSKREARQRIEAGAVRLEGTPHKDPNEMVAIPQEGLKLQAGKKHRFLVTVGS